MPERSSKHGGGARRRGTRVPTPRTLAFDEDAEPPVGASARERYPRERTLEAGQTGGELTHTDISADDASPQTLLDDDPSHTPSANEQRTAADQVLNTAGARVAGVGDGADEAEQAQTDPVGADTARRLKARSRRHARDARFFEPAAAREQAAREHSGRPRQDRQR